jgi:N-acetyl-anhydromuramyl-L-alanine amidase AmpD
MLEPEQKADRKKREERFFRMRKKTLMIYGIPLRKKTLVIYGIPLLSIIVLLGFGLFLLIESMHRAPAVAPLEQAFQRAASETGVPITLLKAVGYSETRFDMHNMLGNAQGPGAYGIMNLVSSDKGVNTVGQAAKALRVSELQVKTDVTTNIRAGAVILKDDAQQLSANKGLPKTLDGWRGAVALYSNAQSRYAANLYVSDVYKALHDGFKIRVVSGETVTIAAQSVTEQPFTDSQMPPTLAQLPVGCTMDDKVEYPGAVDCILDPKLHDCMQVPGTDAPCSYLPADRPKDLSITQIVIHDTEGDRSHTLSVFQQADSSATVQYVVGNDGTVYQIVPEKDVAFHAGNLWYNQHSIGIEHEGYASSGTIWYTPAMYQASAKLVAYLCQKYHIPLDHDHIVSHGTIQSPTLANIPNHVDPGMYWQWSYYLQQIHEQGVSYPQEPDGENIITLHLAPNASSGNVNFFYLYNSPRIDPHNLIPQSEIRSDMEDETDNVETAVSYYYLSKMPDQSGSGNMMYQIWYGESVDAQGQPPNQYMQARLAWLAVPPGVASAGQGTVVRLHSADGKPVQISGSPKSNTSAVNFYIGNAPDGATFVSAYQVIEDGTHNQWYEINYNHRQSWVPASAIQVVH